MESSLLIKAAAKLQTIKDTWESVEERQRSAELDEALTYNRRLWTILVTSATSEDSALPHEVKQNMANLGLFVFNHTMRTMIRPEAERLDSLININRQIAAGLRAAPAAAASAGPAT
ncbi:flagellar biosynthesis regulator FlaF [Hartmannibacter diazotrophicus]|uniref:flagellar biosynthesis regulator FlaF n=1 Tax=Hartmannibacter diazotrophicus TaxID=1482074 RepID=UPI001FE6095B|nr:flagellar biosynthesis regulator FlaF [Hartmannibacter diazotrophicus]